MAVTDLDLDLVAELRRIAEVVAREAGGLVLGRPDRVEVAATKTSPQDVVTAMDLASENLLARRLAELRPQDGLLGEESGFRAGTSGVTWVVDPIDGTTNYLYGLPSYSVSVAAVTGPAGAAPDPSTWTVLAGCVHAPVDGRTFSAGRGLGATRDGVPLHLAAPPELDLCLVGTGFGYRREVRALQARVLTHVLPRVRDLRRLGSAALDLCAVADGTLDLQFERGLNPWDVAAAWCVLTEAGGVLTGLRGAPAGVIMTVAGDAGRVAELAALLEQAGADDDVPAI